MSDTLDKIVELAKQIVIRCPESALIEDAFRIAEKFYEQERQYKGYYKGFSHQGNKGV